MAKSPKLGLPIAPLPDLMRWWQSQDVRGIIIGGLAVALLGRPRVTRDVDAMVLLAENRWSAFLKAGNGFGFVPRQPNTLAFAHEARVLLLHHQQSGIDVDIAIGSLEFEVEAAERATVVCLGGASVPLPTPEDLIVMKAIAHRERDMLDIEGLLTNHPKIDIKRIRYWTRAFADALESPEIYDDLQKQLARRRPRRRGKGKP